MGSIPEKLPFEGTVAIQPNDAKSVADLSSRIAALSKSLSLDNNDERLQLLHEARSLVQALETPRETMISHLWAQPAVCFAIASGVKSGLFKFMARSPGPKSVDELASALRFDPDVLSRLMRHLAAMGYLKEIRSNEYEATNFTKSLSLPIIADGYSCVLGGVWPTFSNFPTYLQRNGWKISNDPTEGPINDIIGKDSNFFEHVQKNYPDGEFQNFMAGYRQGRASWMDPDFFPVADRLIQGADTSPDSAFIVDIGGGIGQDLDEFCRKRPEAPGRHILQDLPHVISQVQNLDPKIETMNYNFHNEQPVKGARAYYLHSVLHDWTDEVCVDILARVTAAMKPGYSKLLVNEHVIPPTGANWQETAVDMVMMTIFASRERTEKQWYKLLESAGLRIVKTWSKGEGVESLIECELA
ncbi:Demethylsterigmatocystin 6-O-methyltransferase 8 [Colletotrichum truncatum]|uniref:Demethylsterigmatocystin 6-O-methyltransferase 8 n=1 Tax=Colletotrichum truncatum TaxID=5467 RepID=A0ACC3YIV6_COLTU|nr:Demethylsterigmatocystin 6-O-methyltransferase 8 [Colletotrichum truncatum]KAF6797092.1 Demethylsterigmatocystin 6-O-methyltransferase 8 [Colletotrichum truncatum]